jgi:hypothetical protein
MMLDMNSTPLMSREDLLSLLKTRICKVVFTKSDGTERTMYATLQQQYLPEMKQDENKPKRSRPDSCIAVWDLENGGWRSFNIDTVNAVSTQDDYPRKP